MMHINDLAKSLELIEEMNRYYEARAPWHDEYMHFESNDKMERQLCPIIESIEEMISGREILEIACGTGNWTLVLARRARWVSATDMSASAIEIARSKLSGYGNVLFVSGDAYELTGPAGNFDTVFAADWWSHIPRKLAPRFLKSVLGTVHPGAKVILVEMSETEYFRHEPSFINEDGDRVSLRRLPDGAEYRVIKNFPTEDELKAVLQPYGQNISYRKFDSLDRWVVTFELSESIAETVG